MTGSPAPIGPVMFSSQLRHVRAGEPLQAEFGQKGDICILCRRDRGEIRDWPTHCGGDLLSDVHHYKKQS